MTEEKNTKQQKAERYLARIRTIGEQSTRNAIILIALLGVVWLSGLEPILSHIQMQQWQQQYYKKQQLDFSTQITSSQKQVDKASNLQKTLINSIASTDSNLEEKPKILQDILQEKEDNAKENINKPNKTYEDIKVKSSLPFLGELILPINLAPLIWSLLVSGLIVYLALTRAAMLSLYAKAAEVYKSESINPETKEMLTETIGSLPWWIAPFPYLLDNKLPEICEIRDAQSLKLNNPIGILRVIIAFLVLLVIQYRVLNIGWISGNDHSEYPPDLLLGNLPLQEPFQDWFIPAIVLSLIMILFGLYRWISPWREPHNNIDKSKRQVLYFIGLSGLTAFVAIGANHLLKTFEDKNLFQTFSFFNSKNNPLFVKKTKAKPYIAKNLKEQEFYFNPNSNIIHYVLDNKTIPGISTTKNTPKEDTWTNESDNRWKKESQKQEDLSLKKLTQKRQTPRVHLSCASLSFERAALVELENKEYQKACKLLLDGINHDLLFKVVSLGKKPSFRLYDLLAGIAVRYQQNKHFDDIKSLIKNNAELEFKSRIKNWEDTNSTWYKKWNNLNKPIIWKMTIRETELKKTRLISIELV